MKDMKEKQTAVEFTQDELHMLYFAVKVQQPNEDFADVLAKLESAIEWDVVDFAWELPAEVAR